MKKYLKIFLYFSLTIVLVGTIVNYSFSILFSPVYPDTNTTTEHLRQDQVIDTSYHVIDNNYLRIKDSVIIYHDERVEMTSLIPPLFKTEKTYFPVEGADVASFKGLGFGYAKDKRKAYFEGVPFKAKEIETLNALSENFARDTKVAYYKRRPVVGSDGRTFVLLSNNTLSGYAKDSKFVYYFHLDEIKIIPCHTLSFAVLAEAYSRDREFVFYENHKISGADTKTFRILSSHYSVDARWAYYDNKRITEADISTFSKMTEEGYSRDKVHIFFEENKIPLADAASFQTLGDHYSKDDHHVYYNQHLLKGANPVTFKVERTASGDANDGRTTYEYGVVSKETLDEGVLENGKRVGIWKMYFTSNGSSANLKGQVAYYRVIDFGKEGNPPWPAIDYYPSGKKQFEGTLVKIMPDKILGYARFYFENGKMDQEGLFDKEGKTGQWKFYHENGRLKVKAQFEHDKETGVWEWFDEKGKLTETEKR